MKNIEKYPNTQDALKAYDGLEPKNMPFDKWLEQEYEELNSQTLLEAAEAVTLAASKAATIIWFTNDSLAEVSRKICNLSAVVEREKHKPLRNIDKYKTAKEAYDDFKKCVTSIYAIVATYNLAEQIVVLHGSTKRRRRGKRNEQRKS